MSRRTPGPIALAVMMPFVLSAQGVRSEREEIKQAIHASIGWANNIDFKLLYSVIANDSNCVEVDPGNRVVRGFGQFKKAETFWGSPDFKSVKYEIRDPKIDISGSADAAGYYCVLDDVNEWKGVPAS